MTAGRRGPADEDRLDRAVRHAVYRTFIHTGLPASPAALADTLSVDEDDVRAGLERLSDRHLLALAPGTHAVRMAHPFSAVPTAFPVDARGVRYWANCAWDVLGIAALLDADTRTTTRCPDCGEDLEVTVREGRAASNAERISFAVPPRHFWDDIGFT